MNVNASERKYYGFALSLSLLMLVGACSNGTSGFEGDSIDDTGFDFPGSAKASDPPPELPSDAGDEGLPSLPPSERDSTDSEPPSLFGQD